MWAFRSAAEAKDKGVSFEDHAVHLIVHGTLHLLGYDYMSIAEIALNCGFCHQEHMTRVFRVECGTTPAAFRRGIR